MNKEPVLTINAAATKAKILGDGRFIATYAVARGINQSTLAQIVNGTYPPQTAHDSVYQRALRTMQKDGYLVQEGEAEHAQQVQAA